MPGELKPPPQEAQKHPQSLDRVRPAGSAALASPDPVGSAVASQDIERLLAQAEQALASVSDNARPSDPSLKEFRLRDFAGAPASTEAATLELVGDMQLDLKIELGRTQMILEDVLKLRKGSVVALDKMAADPVEIFVNGRMIARGEVLVLNDNFCVRVTELVAGAPVH